MKVRDLPMRWPKLMHESRLADPRLAFDVDDAQAIAHLAKVALQRFKLVITANVDCEPAT